ncbi:MAG: glucosamine-6-phosphate deaminase [Fastidiosipilaceae bacterium]
MDIKVFKNIDEASLFAANLIADVVKRKPDAILGLTTGLSSIQLYRYLVDWYNKGELDFSKVRSIILDEYIGLDGNHVRSFRYFMNENFFNHINIDLANTFLPNGVAADLDSECRRFDDLCGALGFTDVQILDIGTHGQIGFNEPRNILRVGTHVEDLTSETIDANTGLFESDEEIPKRAFATGIGQIMRSKQVILLAFGKEKAPIIRAFGDDDVTTSIPISLLKLHPNVILIVDEDAGAELLK